MGRARQYEDKAVTHVEQSLSLHVNGGTQKNGEGRYSLAPVT